MGLKSQDSSLIDLVTHDQIVQLVYYIQLSGSGPFYSSEEDIKVNWYGPKHHVEKFACTLNIVFSVDYKDF